MRTRFELLIDTSIDKIKSLSTELGQSELSEMNITIHQLEKIIYELTIMKKIINSKEFTPSYARIIIDSWNYDIENELYNNLLKIEEMYFKVK